jgi:hypothetical protein
MAIFKANYVHRNPNERTNAKGSVRYIQHRRGKDGEKITRTLYGPDGLMERSDAYRMIDEATKGSFFYRFVISPDPQAEDHYHDLDMRDIAMQTMAALEDRFGVPLNWVAATHSDHAPHLHAHVIALVPNRLSVHDLALLREKATQACLDQRLFLDQSLTRERERPYPAFSLDTYAPYLDSLSDLSEACHGDRHEVLPVGRQAIRDASRLFDPKAIDGADGTRSPLSPSRTAGNWGRYAKSAPSQHLPAGGSSPPLYRGQYTCTCPRCQASHVHHTRDPVHRCDACGLLLHRQNHLTLPHSKGRGLGWQL